MLQDFMRGAFRTDRKAEVVSRYSIGRYLDNSQFLELFQKGWIGRTSVGAYLLSRYVQDQLGNGNSVIVATVPTSFGERERRRRRGEAQ